MKRLLKKKFECDKNSQKINTKKLLLSLVLNQTYQIENEIERNKGKNMKREKDKENLLVLYSLEVVISI
jgi:hypothetical protein